MKTISDYTIYCTPEQTKKALELGASIRSGNDINLYDKKDDTNCLYSTPTAEQMIGWIEEKGVVVDVFPLEEKVVNQRFGFRLGVNWKYRYNMVAYNSRGEATLAAIDAALEYFN